MASPDLLNESFEATGAGGFAFSTAGTGRLDTNGWIGHLGAGSVLDADNADVARPSGGGSELLKIQCVSPNFRSRATFPFGAADIPIVYAAYYVYITAEGLADTNAICISRLYSSAGIFCSSVLLRQSGADLVLRCQVYSGGTYPIATYPAAGSIALNTWHLVEQMHDVTNDLYQTKVNGTSVISGALTDAHGAGVRYFRLGDYDAAYTLTAYYDRVKASSTGWPTFDTWTPKVIMVM